MGPFTILTLATIAFVGSHLLLSHPLRAPLVSRLGEKGFLGLYALIALITLLWMVHAAATAPPAPLHWVAPVGLWHLATLVMWFAAVLLAGSLTGNPALPNPDGTTVMPAQARGVFAVTRHPMMWAILIWAIVHMLLWGSNANLIVTIGIGALALLGMRGQDARKARLIGQPWRDWQTKTSFAPFHALLGGRVGWRAALPSPMTLISGTLIWLVATYVHPLLGGPIAGPWLWLS